jgi:hypothetical protein
MTRSTTVALAVVMLLVVVFWMLPHVARSLVWVV